MEKNSTKRIMQFALLCILVTLTYWPVISSKYLFDVDLAELLKPLLSHKSLSSYFSALLHLKTFDVQPVRDLFLYFNFKLGQVLPWPIITFLLFNFSLWITCCYLVWRLFEKICNSKWVSYIGALIFSLHPVFSQTIPWQSSSKHILSLLFILISIHTFLNYTHDQNLSVKRGFILCLSFTLSIFSQPIAILIPFWFLFYLFLNFPSVKIKRGAIITLTILCLIMGFGMLINYLYYSSSYLLFSEGVPKFAEVGLPERLLAFGRYFFQLLVPIIYARFYYEGALWNLIGLLVIPIFFYIVGKLIGHKQTMLWGALWFLPLFLVNAKPTVIFVSDTYLLLSAVGFFILILLSIERVIKKFPQSKNIFIGVTIILISFFTIKTHTEAKLWTTPLEYIKTSYHREKSCLNIINYSLLLWHKPLLRNEAMTVTEEAIIRGCTLRGKKSGALTTNRNAFIATIYFTKKLTTPEKEKLLIINTSKNPYSYLFLAAIYIQQEQLDKAEKILEPIFQRTDIMFISPNSDPALMEIETLCKKVSSPQCTKINKWLEKVKKSASSLKPFEPEALKD